MARIRTIKPEYWTDSDILKLSITARLFYIGLWNFADDNGVIEYDAVSIKAKIFPADNINVAKLVLELQQNGKVLFYEVEKRQYLLVKNLKSHQVIDRPRKSALPLPNENQLKSTEIIESSVGIGKERIGRERIGEDSKPNGSPEDFILALKNNTAYKHVNIDMELAKMDAWFLAHPGRQKTKKFIVAWLNKIEKPLPVKQPDRPVYDQPSKSTPVKIEPETPESIKAREEFFKLSKNLAKEKEAL